MFNLSDFANHTGNLMLKSKEREIQANCIETLASLPQTNTNIIYLRELLEKELAPELLPLVINKLSKFPSVNLSAQIEKYLNHSQPYIFIESCLYLHRNPHYKHKHDIEDRLVARLSDQNNLYFTDYLRAVGELKQKNYSQYVVPYLNSSKITVRLAAFEAYTKIFEGQLNTQVTHWINGLKAPHKEIKLLALQSLKECPPLTDWKPVIALLNAKDHMIVKESRNLLQQHLNICEPELIRTALLSNISVQQRFEILSLIYRRLDNDQRANLQKMAKNSLGRFVKTTAIARYHDTKKDKYREVHAIIGKILQEIASEYLLNIITVITFETDQNQDFYQRVTRGLLSTNRAQQGNALEVLSNAGERKLTEILTRFFEERLVDPRSIGRFHLINFAEPINLANDKEYETALMAIEHDMLKACLYFESLKFGKTDIRLDHLSKPVRDLLKENIKALPLHKKQECLQPGQLDA
jgi:hypothetical protein